MAASYGHVEREGPEPVVRPTWSPESRCGCSKSDQTPGLPQPPRGRSAARIPAQWQPSQCSTWTLRLPSMLESPSSPDQRSEGLMPS